ncbi:MAG: hypothetical protein ABSD48_06815 [Armatimonadota bacterium]
MITGPRIATSSCWEHHGKWRKSMSDALENWGKQRLDGEPGSAMEEDK